jgi:hypothetical protein
MGGSSSSPARLVLLVLLLTGCRVDHGLAPRPATWSGIEGTVTFQGEWLDDLEEVRVAVYRDYPPADSSDFFRIAGFSDPIPLGVSSADYRVALAEGDYEWVVTAGRKAGQGWVEGYVFLAQFAVPPANAVPSAIRIYENLATRDVDLVVDFSDLPEPPVPGSHPAR